MSIPIPISQQELDTIKQQLQSQDEVICLDKATHIKTLLVGMEILKFGEEVKAKIVKGY